MTEAVNENDLETRVSQARLKLANLVPFLGVVLLHASITVVADDVCPTACVNQKGHIQIGRDFGSKLSQAELIGVLCHEILHPAMLYWARMGPRIPMLGNIAHDFAINDIITLFAEGCPEKDAIKLPSSALWNKEYRDMSFEEIYDKIMEDQSFRTQSMAGFSMDCVDGDGDGSGNKEGQGDQEGQGGMSAVEDKNATQEWKIVLATAAQAQEKLKRGTLPGALKSLIEEILSPTIDWKTQLSRWVGERGRRIDPSYRRPGRRSDSMGEMCPTNIPIYPDILVLWDTSGSMYSDHKAVVAEIAAMLEMLGNIRLISCDAAVHVDTKATDINEVMESNVGGGGSDFRPAFDRMEEDAYRGPVIALTDGAISVPEYQPEGIEVLWVLVNPNYSPPAEWGDVITLPG